LIQLLGNNAAPVPGVNVKVLQGDQTTEPSVACVADPGQPAGTVLTNASGIATCNLIFSGKTGTSAFFLTIGGGGGASNPYWKQYPSNAIPFQVNAGPPAAIKLVSGNNQSVNSGQTLPAPLVAEVDDASGNPLPNVDVTWDVPQGQATLTNSRTISDANGRVSSSAIAGGTGGAVQIRVRAVSNPSIQLIFNISVNLNITALQILSGNNQSAAYNTQFAQPLVVQVNNGSQPVPGVGVSFAVTSGPATLSSPTATTDANGRAQVTATAGSTSGAATVVATAGTFTQTFSLTVRPPGPGNVTFSNGAGFQPNFIAPCSVATITGTGLATGLQGVVTPGNLIGPLPVQIANVQVRFGNTLAPIYNVANINGQESVTVQVPCDVTPGSAQVTITVGGGSNTFTTQVQAVAPGIFQVAMSDNVRRGVLVKPDGSFVSLENPARRGEIVRMYTTGLGPALPAPGTNQFGLLEQNQDVQGSVVVGVNNAGVPLVKYARYAANMIGVYEVAFQVPDDAPAGNNVPLAISVGGVFGNGSSLPIQ
jgi:uncharacterized protein (TIGR03437 family)